MSGKLLSVVALLCFVGLSFQLYELETFPTVGLSYEEWRDYAYQQQNPSGLSCGHAATYKDERGWWDILNLMLGITGGGNPPPIQPSPLGKRNPKFENPQFDSLTKEEREEYYEHVLELLQTTQHSEKRDETLFPRTRGSTFLGAVKEPSSTTFYWDVGGLRGQPFFSIFNDVVGTGKIPITYFVGKRDVQEEREGEERLIPLTSLFGSKKRLPTKYLSYEDGEVQFETGFRCLQEYCFPRSFIHYFAYSEFSKALFFTLQTSNSVIEDENFAFGEIDSVETDIPVEQYSTTYINYGFFDATESIIEYEDVLTIANYHGGSKYRLYPGTFGWIEANEAANADGLYLARVPSPEQFQWIVDELQCLTDELFWTGYKLDTLTQDFIRGPGPGEGRPIFSTEYGFIPGEYRNRFNLRTMPGIAPDSAIVIGRSIISGGDYTTFPDVVTSNNYVIVQAEPCSFAAKDFFGIDFQAEQRREKMCYPNPSNVWSADPTEVYDGVNGYVQGNAFFAGQSHTFTNPFNQKSATMYFDCQCKTNPIINLSCLGSDQWPGCQLYTNAWEYYDAGLYEQRLQDPGLAESYKRMEAYYYWIYLLNQF